VRTPRVRPLTRVSQLRQPLAGEVSHQHAVPGRDAIAMIGAVRATTDRRRAGRESIQAMPVSDARQRID